MDNSLQNPKILMIDDDPSFCLAMSKALRRRGFAVEVIQDSDLALKALHHAPSDTVVVLDLKMPKRSGLELLQLTPKRQAPVLMLTGHGAVPEAVKAMKAGAYTFLSKPIDAVDLEPMIRQAYQSVIRVSEPQGAIPVEFIGQSSVADSIRTLSLRLAETSAPILMMGETGTGKEVVARFIHMHSSRRSLPFIPVNMASFSRRTLEVELFGQLESQSSTHHQTTNTSLIAEVKQGTLFLDEIDELSLENQAQLLRFIEDGSYSIVGEGRTQHFSGRLIASTNKDLAECVREGRFRADLFHRLNVYPLCLPPLCEREEDVLYILRYWFQRITQCELKLTTGAQAQLLRHTWPGNVREVVNLARRIGVLCVKQQSASHVQEITEFDLQSLLNHQLFKRQYSTQFTPISPKPPGQVIFAETSNSQTEISLGGDFALEHIEREHILKLIQRHGNVSQVARILNVNRRTLQRKLKVWTD